MSAADELAIDAACERQRRQIERELGELLRERIRLRLLDLSGQEPKARHMGPEREPRNAVLHTRETPPDTGERCDSSLIGPVSDRPVLPASSNPNAGAFDQVHVFPRGRWT